MLDRPMANGNHAKMLLEDYVSVFAAARAAGVGSRNVVAEAYVRFV